VAFGSWCDGALFQLQEREFISDMAALVNGKVRTEFRTPKFFLLLHL